MHTLHKTLLITSSLLLVVGAGCTQSTTTNLNSDQTNTSNLNTVVDGNANEVVENTNVVSNTNINTPNTNVAANANENTNSDQGSEVDTSSWNQFTFNDLGFSILLPFEKNSIETNYTECDEQSGCDMYGYSYSASLSVDENAYVIIRSVSKNWSPSRRAFFGEIYDLVVQDGIYTVLLPGDKDYNIQPIGEPINIGGVQLYLFDAYDYYSQTKIVIDEEVEFQEGAPKEQYAAVFELPDNEKYESAIITFEVTDMSLGELRTAIESLNFF